MNTSYRLIGYVPIDAGLTFCLALLIRRASFFLAHNLGEDMDGTGHRTQGGAGGAVAFWAELP